jgi:hypothetical protein
MTGIETGGNEMEGKPTDAETASEAEAPIDADTEGRATPREAENDGTCPETDAPALTETEGNCSETTTCGRFTKAEIAADAETWGKLTDSDGTGNTTDADIDSGLTEACKLADAEKGAMNMLVGDVTMLAGVLDKAMLIERLLGDPGRELTTPDI